MAQQQCPNCGALNAPDQRFCSYCGSPLPTAAAPVAQPPFPQSPAGSPPPQYGQPPHYGPSQQYQQPQYQQPQYQQPYPQQQYPQPPQYQQPQYQQPPQYQQQPPGYPQSPGPSGQYPQQPGYYQQPQQPPPKQSRKGCGCCLLILLLLIGTPVLIYFLFSSGTITQRQVLLAIGQGPGEIKLYNLSDGTLDVRLDLYSDESSQYVNWDSMSLNPEEIDSFADIEQGRYRLRFTYEDGGDGGGPCNIKLENADLYSFVAVPEGVAITRDKEEPRTNADMRVDSSPICDR